MEKASTSDLTLHLELSQGKRLVAVLESIPRDSALVELLAILEHQVKRRRKDLARSEDGAREEAIVVPFRERRSRSDGRGISTRPDLFG
jgi:hypothetical protein